MAARREIPFVETASVPLFEILIVAGAPAVGFFNTIKDAKGMQKTLTRLRQMWQRADALFIPPTDLNALHSMHSKSQGAAAGAIPAHIASDHRKLARYYIFLLFRYCVSAASRDSSFSVYFYAPSTNRSDVHLPDVPPSWLDGRVSLMYPSAPPSEPALPCQQPYHAVPAWQPHFNLAAGNEAPALASPPLEGQRVPFLGQRTIAPRTGTTNARAQPPTARGENHHAPAAIGRGFSAHRQTDADGARRDNVRLYPALPAQRPAAKQAYELDPYDSHDEESE